MTPANTRADSGNALFLILIGVALFAALSYAVTQTGRGGSSTSKEQVILLSGRISDYAASLESAVNRMPLINKVNAYDLYFNQNVSKRNDGTLVETALGSPADPSLYVFHAQGGGVAAQVFEDASKPCSGASSCATAAWKAGHTGIRWYNIPGVGTSTADLTLVVILVSDAVCAQLSKASDTGGTMPSIAIPDSAIPSPGTPPSASLLPLTSSGGGAPAFAGMRDFCAKDNLGNTYYMHVLAVY